MYVLPMTKQNNTVPRWLPEPRPCWGTNSSRGGGEGIRFVVTNICGKDWLIHLQFNKCFLGGPWDTAPSGWGDGPAPGSQERAQEALSPGWRPAGPAAIMDVAEAPCGGLLPFPLGLHQ
jgi:hypothetical protein